MQSFSENSENFVKWVAAASSFAPATEWGQQDSAVPIHFQSRPMSPQEKVLDIIVKLSNVSKLNCTIDCSLPHFSTEREPDFGLKSRDLLELLEVGNHWKY